MLFCLCFKSLGGLLKSERSSLFPFATLFQVVLNSCPHMLKMYHSFEQQVLIIDIPLTIYRSYRYRAPLIEKDSSFETSLRVRKPLHIKSSYVSYKILR